MSKVLTIARRELRAYFTSPVFWVLATAFMLFFGLIFGFYVTQGAAATPMGGGGPQAEMRDLLGLIATLMLFITPLLAMRLLAEEQRAGTLELLMTSPVQDWQVVVGKWLAAFLTLTAMIALTLFHVGIMQRLATQGMAVGPLVTSYLGILLLGAALLGLGVLTSALTDSQVVAGFVGIMAVMLLWFIGLLGSVAGTDSAVGASLEYLSLSDHYLDFGQGVIDSRDVIYFVTLTIGTLFVATRVLESRRWR
jgi:ABC-2 type transport system permease protein